MSEKLHDRGAEKAIPKGGEKLKSTEALEKLRSIPEKSVEKPGHDREKNIERARQSLEQERLATREKPSEKRESEGVHRVFTKKQQRMAYKSEMKKIQSQLPPATRVFSKIVHNPVVETVSDVAAETVFRPSFLITGALGGLIVGGGLYIVAKMQGFILPNSQFIIGFLIGGVLGVVVEVAIRIFRPKK